MITDIDKEIIRQVFREELERHERVKGGDIWVDGCENCGASTHGTRMSCPWPVLAACCSDRQLVRSETHKNGKAIYRVECENCRSWNEMRERR